ncbi:arylsulfatase [uncultured Algibacter sp.]|uniref:arylsulfatase n=1 Tax=uncultured Algibacter sp. TaxID=298659 RepID=UPI00261095D3|nr:arylsulfatase [uncultured Algibacter sp.]
MKKLSLFLIIILFALIGCKKNKKQEIVETNKPNVILVITDDQGYGDIAAHGNKIIKTPNIDNFYKESYHLTDFHVNPTCAPTRSGLMTGRFANSTGVWHTVGGWSLLREQEKTMANMFSENGYATGAFGKWHMGDNYPFRAHDRGFQETVMHYGGGVQQTPDYWNNTYFDDTYFKNGKPEKYQGYCTNVFFNEAINFIKKKQNQPFFCYISTNAPHGPYNVPPAYYNLYKDLSTDVLSDTQKRFYGMISNADENFGKLRQTLKELKIADNTIIIFMTDNGTSSGFHNRNGKVTGFNAGMRGTKGSEYEGGHRVPFFIHWKDGNISKAKDISMLTAQIDILPTLADLCDLNLPKNHKPLDGKSLVPVFKNSDTLYNRMLVTDSQRVQEPIKWKNCSVMHNKWRLVNGIELYNIENDKGQENNIAIEHPERVKRMKAFYEKWWSQVSVEFNNQVYFKIGHEKENPTVLTAHDVHSNKDNYVWNQIKIRKGDQGSGYWSIDVQEDAEYEISLRRYPIEANLPINHITPQITTQDVKGLQFNIPEGKDLSFTKASIEFENAFKRSDSIPIEAKSVNFQVTLKAGKTKFKASFFDNNNLENIAYYVYINKINTTK